MNQTSTATSVPPTDFGREFEERRFNPCVGQILISQDDRSRVWYIHLRPGERLGFHRHVLDYFWTCLTRGRGCSRLNGGAPVERDYAPGETRHLKYGPGEFLVHDLENVGTTDLVFVTVELKESANEPLPLPEGVAPTGAIPDMIRLR